MKRRDVLRWGAGLVSGVLGPWVRRDPLRTESVRAPGSGLRTSERVLVVGAGASGLAAARRLVSEFGLSAPGQVVVLEARDRIGGRVHTDSSLSIPVDLGASWIHGPRGNPIAELAEEFGVRTVATSEDQEVYDEDGSKVSWLEQGTSISRYGSAYDRVQAHVAGLAADQSLAQSFVDVGADGGAKPKAKRLFHWWAHNLLESGWTAYTSQLSSRHHDMGAEFGGSDRVFPGGYSQIVDGLARGLDVRMEHVVEAIEYGAEGVTVRTDRGTFEADRCTVTLPLGVLKAGSVAFSPELPDGLRGAIGRMGFGAVYKLALEFERAFWNAKPTCLSMVSSKRQHVDWFNTLEYTDVPILTTWACQDLARSLESMPPDDAVARVMQDLRKIYGNGTPDPIRTCASSWISSPFTGGSYSFPAVGSTPADYDEFGLAVGDRLLFAGEHTSSDHPATVHGAYLSGRRAAERAISVAKSAR